MLLENENFTIYEVESLKEEFISELQNDSVTIDMQNVSKIDMSAISLLISLKKSTQNQNKKFHLQNCSDAVLMSLSVCGCDSYLGVYGG